MLRGARARPRSFSSFAAAARVPIAAAAAPGARSLFAATVCGKPALAPADLEGKVCWVVGGVDVFGRRVVGGLLDAGATVIANTRSPSRLEALVEGLGRPDRLHGFVGSLLPGSAEATVAEAMDMTANRLDHVVVHGGVRYWARRRGECDETGTLARDRLFDLSDDDFAKAAVQLPSLHFSAARLLLPRLAGDEGASYTTILGAPADAARSPLGGINVRACHGVAAALARERVDCRVNVVNVAVPGGAPGGEEDAFLDDLGALAAGIAGRTAGDAALALDINETADLSAMRDHFPARVDGGLRAAVA